MVASSNRRLKLLQTELLTFGDKVEEWLSFGDTFDTVIDKRDGITNVNSALKDEALRKIQVFAITKENLQRA